MARPIAAGVLTMLGGVFIFFGGIAIAFLGAIFALFGFVSSLFLIGLLLGALTVLVGLLMIAFPSGHAVWGILAVALAFASLPFALGGFLLGFLLTLLGGALAFRWRRPMEPYVTVSARTVPPPE